MHYYMVGIANYTELNLQICNYAQKRRICHKKRKQALEKFLWSFCPRRKAANFCQPDPNDGIHQTMLSFDSLSSGVHYCDCGRLRSRLQHWSSQIRLEDPLGGCKVCTKSRHFFGDWVNSLILFLTKSCLVFAQISMNFDNKLLSGSQLLRCKGFVVNTTARTGPNRTRSIL